MENAIEVRDVVIKYRSFKKMSIKKDLFKFGKNKTEYYTAVNGVSFDVPKGKIVGLIGSNGSGKSTILRAMAGIYSPDEGTINTFGHSISLLALGVGFQKKLTGKENILLSGMLMGFSEEEINAKMKKIVEFAEIGEFIDKPVSTYSSGMHSKLAFAITSTLETDIILIDEVLSVGDAKFRKKSHDRMRELIEDANRTVVVVSHNLKTLKNLCNEVIWLEKGEIKMQGNPEEVISEYSKVMKVKKKKKKKKKIEDASAEGIESLEATSDDIEKTDKEEPIDGADTVN